MTQPGVMAALIAAIGLLVASIVATFVKRGTDKQSAQLTIEQNRDDQRQEDLEAARAAAAAARVEADNARIMLTTELDKARMAIAELWRQLNDVNAEMERMRRQHRQDIDDSEAYIMMLHRHINERREPPPPPRPPVSPK